MIITTVITATTQLKHPSIIGVGTGGLSADAPHAENLMMQAGLYAGELERHLQALAPIQLKKVKTSMHTTTGMITIGCRGEYLIEKPALPNQPIQYYLTNPSND